MIELKRLLDGTLVYETPFAALDDARFERVRAGFGAHYEVEQRNPDAFAFGRGEGYTRLERWDAFGYVDRGTATRLRAEAVMPHDGIAVLPAGFRALRFTLNMRVILVFWLAVLLATRFVFFDGTNLLLWLGGFLTIYALHVWLVMASLDRKLARWLARETWH